MDRLMTVKEFIELRYTPGSAPHIKTIQDRVRRGDIPGIKDGGTWMVNISKLERQERPAADDVDELVDLICSSQTQSSLMAFK